MSTRDDYPGLLAEAAKFYVGCRQCGCTVRVSELLLGSPHSCDSDQSSDKIQTAGSARADYPRQPVGSVAAHEQRERMLDEIDRLRTSTLARDHGLVCAAGDALAAAASRVCSEYDGVHRLRAALSEWFGARSHRSPSSAVAQSSPSMPTEKQP